MGILSILDVARTALSVQQYGVDVTGHNIANVNTPEYSRQNPIVTAREPAMYGGQLFGRGVDLTSIVRSTDQLVEKQLRQEKSSMVSSQEMENYMRLFEGLFNENSGTSISALLSGFWNSWQDISNNPSGVPERIALYEHAGLMSGQLNALNSDLTQIETDLTSAVSVGIERINQITSEIGILNGQIVSRESDGSNANDLRDQRVARVSELSEYMDVQTFEQGNSALTVATVRGGILVSEKENFELKLGGTNGDRVQWENSSGTTVDITDYLTNGKLGGWLEMRDEIVAKYKLDLDAVTKEFVWSVNEQHSQGMGLNLFDAAITGTYETGSSGLLATLAYGDKIDYTKDFKMWTYDSGSTSPVPVDVDMGISTANPGYGGNFTTANTTYTIGITQGGTVNTDAIQFKWSETGGGSGTGTMAAGSTNVVIHGNTLNFTTGDVLVAGNTLQINTVALGTSAPVVMTPTGTANNILDTYTFTVDSASGGTIGTDNIEIDWSNSTTSGTFTLTASDTTVTVDGMTLPFTSGYLFAGDAFTITTDANGTPSAALPSDWHWTLDSFVDQFNRQTPRVTASKTSDNALKFTPYTAGSDRELKNHSYSGGVTAANTTVTVNNYDMLTTSTPSGTPFTVTQTPAIENTADTIVGETAGVTITTPAEADESVTGIVLTWTAGGGGSWAVTNDGGFTGGISIGSVDTATEVRLELGGSGTDDITIAVTGAGAADTETVTFDINTDNWRVSNVPPAYSLNSGDDIGGDNDGFGIDLNGDGSSDIAVSFTTPLTADGIVAFDIAAATGTYSFGFSDDTAQDAGLTAALGINTFFQGNSAGSIGTNTVLNNKDYIAAAQLAAGTGDLAAGDNSNALAIADLQYTSTVISQWTTDRINGNTEGSVTATVEGYYHGMVGSIGVTASSISRAKEFNEVMVNQLREVRDSISAVSLDEEMTNLIKFQHAYAAAAKLITVADEMYVTLLQVK